MQSDVQPDFTAETSLSAFLTVNYSFVPSAHYATYNKCSTTSYYHMKVFFNSGEIS